MLGQSDDSGRHGEGEKVLRRAGSQAGAETFTDLSPAQNKDAAAPPPCPLVEPEDTHLLQPDRAPEAGFISTMSLKGETEHREG